MKLTHRRFRKAAEKLAARGVEVEGASYDEALELEAFVDSLEERKTVNPAISPAYIAGKVDGVSYETVVVCMAAKGFVVTATGNGPRFNVRSFKK